MGGPGRRPQRSCPHQPSSGPAPCRPRRRRGEAVLRRDRRFRPAGKGTKKGHPQGPEGHVPRVPDGRRGGPTGPARRRPGPGKWDPERTGISFGVDYMLSAPEEFAECIQQCLDEAGKFQFLPLGRTKGCPRFALVAAEVFAQHARQPPGNLQRPPRAEQLGDASRGGGEHRPGRGLPHHSPRQRRRDAGRAPRARGCTP